MESESTESEEFRWVDTSECLPEFGDVYYNEISELIFIRRVSHEFDDMTAQVRGEKPRRFTRNNVVFIGVL